MSAGDLGRGLPLADAVLDELPSLLREVFDVDGRLLTDKLWGLYYKPDFNFGGIQGGASPYKVEGEPDKVAIDPYGPDSPDFIVGDDFIETWCSMLAHCQKRFEGKIGVYKKDERSAALAASRPIIFRSSTYSATMSSSSRIRTTVTR